MSASRSASGFTPVSQAATVMIEKLRPLSSTDAATDGILFSGARHEIVPRALFLDRRLTPLERNAWQIIRMMVNEDGVTAFPTYAQLRPYLASAPCAEQASDETVARALMLLRLARWLTLVRHRRDVTTGRIQCNLYVLHDEPLTPYESVQLDPHYLELVSHSLAHASKAIQRVGCCVLKEATEDPFLSSHVLPSRLHYLMQRLADRGWMQSESPSDERDVVPEQAGMPEDAYRTTPSSESEDGARPEASYPLRNPKMDSTVRTHLNNEEVRTIPSALDAGALRLPEAFHRLRAEHQTGALAALQRVEPGVQQAVLDEWAARCRSSVIRNPAGYLFGVLQKAIRGEFRAWASERVPREHRAPVRAPLTERNPDAQVSKEQAKQHIAKLRSLLDV